MPKAHDLELLKFIASRGGLSGSVSTSTAEIAACFGISQQSASRKVRELSASGCLRASATPKGITAELTEKGASLLKSQLAELQGILGSKKARSLVGIVESGLGEGKYYVTQENYNRQLSEFLQGRVYPGTLNIKVDEPELGRFTASAKPFVIGGFSNGERTFGAIKCYAVKINNRQQGALVLPERTTHPSDVAELVSQAYLRGELKLNDGSKVVVTM